MGKQRSPGAPEGPNFLLGNGHILTSEVVVRKGMQEKPPPYTVEEAKARVSPMLGEAAQEAAELSADACPGNLAVALLTLHPQYTAKSYYPSAFLEASDLSPIGSRGGTVVPERLKGGVDTPPKTEPKDTVELFVAGSRLRLAQLSEAVADWGDDEPASRDLFKVESLRLARPQDRMPQPAPAGRGSILLDVALHTPDDLGINVFEAFLAYAEALGATVLSDRQLEVGGLTFVPVRAVPSTVASLGRFAFLRVLRGMPELRPLRPVIRSAKPLVTKPLAFPSVGPVDAGLRAAVFDGGVRSDTAIRHYVTAIDAPGVGAPLAAYLEHGTGVTSAILFGPIPESGDLPQPYAHVDHYRVLDATTTAGGPDLYDVLFRIRDVLQTGRYQFANLSLGPAYPIEDNDVNPWTSVLDSLLSDANTLLTVAVGNDGNLDRPSGLARVQVPSDSVNALAVGACDSTGELWDRCGYSCVGPGRRPGRVKPDTVVFGGDLPDTPFPVLNAAASAVVGKEGTSYSAPYALRKALGIRSHFGTELNPLAIKALLVHCCECDDGRDREEVGWGRLPEDLYDYVTCKPAEVRVVYQGRLNPAQYLRAPIPWPAEMPNGRVTIKATFCIASATDPEDPCNYTRSGLDITFRPHAETSGGQHARSSAFFRSSDYESESQQRQGHKWETVAHATKRMASSSLSNPVFDVHYQTRIGGRKQQRGEAIHYALIVSVSAPKMPDIYNRVVQRYRTQLQPIRPVQAIQVRV